MKQGEAFEFVCLCTCVGPDDERLEKITNAADAGLDWELVYKIAMDQKVYPFLYRTLKHIAPDKVPEQMLSRLKRHYIANAARNIQLTSFLTHVLTLLKSHTIQAVPFKGPVLSQEIYGSMDLRQFADLDILISVTDAEKAWDLLISHEFLPELNLTPKQRTKYIKTEDNLSFFKNKIAVELHWELTGLYLSSPLTLERIKDRLVKTDLLGTEVSSLSMEDQLVYLCVHGAKHGWESLEQICCVAEILKTNKTINWSLVEQLALEWRCTRMLYQGLSLAQLHLTAPVPLFMMEKINKDKQITTLQESVYAVMRCQTSSVKTKHITGRFSVFHLKIRDSFLDKLIYALRIIFCPTNKEWLYFPVPAALSFLHYGLRPLRLIKQGVMKKNA